VTVHNADFFVLPTVTKEAGTGVGVPPLVPVGNTNID
jgi:hypothetical protein